LDKEVANVVKEFMQHIHDDMQKQGLQRLHDLKDLKAYHDSLEHGLFHFVDDPAYIKTSIDFDLFLIKLCSWCIKNMPEGGEGGEGGEQEQPAIFDKDFEPITAAVQVPKHIIHPWISFITNRNYTNLHALLEAVWHPHPQPGYSSNNPVALFVILTSRNVSGQFMSLTDVGHSLVRLIHLARITTYKSLTNLNSTARGPLILVIG